MREVTPKGLQKLNDKSWKETQKIFRRRLREIAKEGNVHAEYQPKDYKCGECIKPWLEGLGFKVKEIDTSWCKITWPEDIGEWIFDPRSYDYVCSWCGKHSEYTSPYCSNCSKKLKPIEGRKYDTE